MLRLVMFHARRLGLLGGVGVALITAVLFYAVAVVPQRNAESISLRAEIARYEADRVALETQRKKSAPTSDSANALDRQPAAMPVVADTPRLLLTLEDMARRNGLQIRRNDYRYVDPVVAQKSKTKSPKTEAEQYVEVKINAPTSGGYGNVRAFLAEALQAMPTLALDDMSLKRESIDKGEVQTLLRFTLFVRSKA